MGIYTGYFDESSHEDDPQFVMGGIVLDAEDAAAFDDDWRTAIKDLPHLEGEPFLHTADFVSGNEQYGPAWKGRYDEKLAILTNAARVISAHSLQIITCSVNMEHYRAADSVVKLSEALGHPYTMAALISYQLILRWANRNCIFSPIKMVLESRHGIGDVIDMFRINGYPAPAPESKGLPQLQAADYLAWMRLKKYQPSSSSERVKGSWKQINRALYADEPFTAFNLLRTMEDLAKQIPGIPFPKREDDRTLITFNSDFKNPRKPFKRTARRNN